MDEDGNASSSSFLQTLLSCDQSTNSTWSTERIESFSSQFYNNIDNILRASKQELIQAFSVAPLEALKPIRTALSNEFLAKIPYGTLTYSMIARTTVQNITTDIFHLVQFLSQKQKDSMPTPDLFQKVFKIKSDKNCHSDTADNTELILAQTRSIDSLASQFKALLEINNRIQKENQELKAIFMEHLNNFKSASKVSSTSMPPPSSSPFVPPLQPPNKNRRFSDVVGTQSPRQANKRTLEQDSAEVLPSNTSAKQSKLKKFDSFNPSKESQALDDTYAFTLKTKRNVKPNVYNKKLGTGSATSAASNLRVCARKQLVFLSQCEADTTVSEVDAFLKTLLFKGKQLSFSGVRQARIRSTKFSAFHFEIDHIDREIVRDKNLWPAGLLVDFSYPQRSSSDSSSKTNTHITSTQ